MRVYAPAGSQAFNESVSYRLEQLAREVKAAVGTPFLALVLGGGYGREEGACVIRDGKESLYNDLDLFLITSSKYRLTDEVHLVRHRYEKELGIDVDIGAPLLVEELRRLPAKLMWHDLYHGHTVLLGPEDIISSNMGTWVEEPLDQVEALHLALNRGSGLLQAIIASADPAFKAGCDPDFIRRNLYKAYLAFGDCLLITLGTYTVQLSERGNRLKAVIERVPSEIAPKALALYSDAIRFKQQPDTLPTEEPKFELLINAAHLWVSIHLFTERIRTDREFLSVEDYCSNRSVRERSQHRGLNLLRNLLINLREKHISLRYPREELYTSLPSLLEAPDPENRAWRESADRFLIRWLRYN